METARLITMLRRIEMPVEQIGELLEAAPETRARLLARYREREADQHLRRQSLAHFIEHAISSGSLEGDDQPGVSRFEVATRIVPEAALLATTRHTSAKALTDVIGDNATRLFELAKQRGGPTGPLIVIYHGQVDWESDGPIEVCVPIENNDSADRIEPEHQELFAAFEAVQQRAAQLGLTPAGSAREIYDSVAEGSASQGEYASPPPYTTKAPGSQSTTASGLVEVHSGLMPSVNDHPGDR